MRKIYFVIGLLIASATSFGQALPGGDMETWRNHTSGSTSAVAIHAPIFWYGFDSLLIADGESFPGFNHFTYYAQLFQESTIKHGGTSSAKLLSKKQDTAIFGVVPGSLSNAKANVNVIALLGGGSLGSATTFTGGTPVAMRVTTVSAWVQYAPGIDTGTHISGPDTGALTVEAHSTVHGADTIVGFGEALITSSGSFVQITANVVYTDTLDTVNNVRIFFSSSVAHYKMDSSTLYVDDVTMTGVPNYHRDNTGLQNVAYNELKVYPNPSTGILYVDGAASAGLSFRLLSISGQLVVDKHLTDNAMDVSYLPQGLYFYAIKDSNGNVVQRGKVNLVK